MLPTSDYHAGNRVVVPHSLAWVPAVMVIALVTTLPAAASPSIVSKGT